MDNDTRIHLTNASGIDAQAIRPETSTLGLYQAINVQSIDYDVSLGIEPNLTLSIVCIHLTDPSMSRLTIEVSI